MLATLTFIGFRFSIICMVVGVGLSFSHNSDIKVLSTLNEFEWFYVNSVSESVDHFKSPFIGYEVTK